MGLPTWAKRKLKENWPSSLFEAIMKVEGFSDVGRSEKFEFKKDNKFFHKKPKHDKEWNVGKEAQQRISLNNSKAQGLNPRGTL
jgi:hypothetical protein